MKLLENILVANDFTKPAENLVATAIGLAKVFDSKITLIHVLPDDIENAKVKSFLHETARQKLEETNARIEDRGVETGEAVLASGSPYEEVARVADRTKVNLVMIGDGEIPKDGRRKLGTTAKRIIQQCSQPVFVVKAGQPLDIKRILCPVDFSRTSGRALRNAVTLARRFEAELVILNVVESPGTGLLLAGKDLDREQKVRRKRQKKKLDRFLEDFKFGGLPWRQEVRMGDAATMILAAIAEQEIDLLVMGTTGKTGFSRWMMGSVAEKVGRDVPCSFVMLKSSDVFRLRLENQLKDLESHFQIAKRLAADGFFDESVEEYKKCLTINNMHVPAYYAIAEVFEEMGQPDQAKTYREYGREILDRIWDQKIEEEIRGSYGK